MMANDVAPTGINWVGLWTLYDKEVRRFLKVFMQTLAAPVVTTLLFLAIFTLAFGGASRIVWDMPFIQFLAPGLIIMAVAQNAFANTSSSLLISKIQGNIVDVLMPPLSPTELLIAFAAAGITRGIAVALAVGLSMWPFVDFHIASWGYLAFFAIAASLMMALFGMLAGIWADKFDHLSAITNFVVTPLTFLSGTFYSIDRLPEPWLSFAHANPFFYMIDGFRYGFIGISDTAPWIGVLVLGGLDILLWVFCHRILITGYKLKA